MFLQHLDHHISISKFTPLAITLSGVKAEDRLLNGVHNNAGFQVCGSGRRLAQEARDAGLILIDLTLTSGNTMAFHVSPYVPVQISENSSGGTTLGCKTHNNGGWKIAEPTEQVLRKFNEALAKFEH